jgi:hypothetical protein
VTPIRHAAELTVSLEEILPLYAEIAIALAGFVGVVSAFAGREREIRPTERVRFVYVVMCAGSVLAGCLAFFTAIGGGLDTFVACQVSGCSSLLVTGLVALQTVPGAWRHANDPDSTTESWSLYVATGAILVELLLFGIAILSGGHPLPLLCGFSLQLLLGLWMFVRLLTRAN